MTALQTKIAERIIVLEGWRAALLSIAAGAASALSLAPFHFSLILFLTLPVLVWLLDGVVGPPNARSPWRHLLGSLWPSFKVGWFFGLGYFFVGFWWVGHAFLVDAEEFIFLLPVAVLTLSAGLALFWGGATALARLAWTDNQPSKGWIRIASLAAALALAEYLRGTVLTGLPWNTLSYGAMPTPLLMQSAGLVGIYGLTFFVVLAATAFVVGLAESKRLTFLSILLVLAHAGYGFWNLSTARTEMVDNIRLRLVQPAIDQSRKWDSDYEAEIMRRYLTLSNANRGPQSASVGAFTHVIWPESAFPFVLTQRPDQIANIARLLPATTTLITGAMRLEGGDIRRVFNSLLVINSDGEIIRAADKTRLVPFGEFLPFQDTLENLGFEQLTRQRGGFATGASRNVISIPTAPPFLPLICYEIIFSGRINQAEERPQWLINVTNDAWFGMSAGPYQHAHQAQVRAVEEGLPVIRAANSGISMVIDPYGRVVEKLALGESGVVDSDLPKPAAVPVFAQLGNTPVVLAVLVLFLFLVAFRRSTTRRL